jgi:two-component system sensor histidine kinase PrrB
MRLATRTAIAAALAAALALSVLAVLFRGQVYDTLLERVDRQLEERAATAPILAAVGDRLSVSELGATVEGARIAADGTTVEVGALPQDPLPPVTEPGWSTVHTDGENWRLYTVVVDDVPEAGDHALVQLAAPLGDVDTIARQQRRTTVLLAVIAIAASAGIGYAFGALATRPLARLRRDAGQLGTSTPAGAPLRERYGSVEVDEIADALRSGLDEVAVEIARREAALDTARSFAASVAHEVRTPLTSAMTNLDVARRTPAGSAAHDEAVADARTQLDRITSSLSALRDLTDAELADRSWFSEFDLADQVAAVAEPEQRRHPDVRIDVAAAGDCTVVAWLDGTRLATANLLRNALAHGRPTFGTQHVVVTVERDATVATVHVDDNGPGIPPEDRERLVRRFERGARSTGSGLGLALVAQIATLHGGDLTLGDSALGGTRATVTIRLGGPQV